jgi:hypothetical protein
MAVPSALTSSSDASYLRRLLERQPACLIRVRLDGVLLACNDAALSLFGVGARRAVLNTDVTDRIVPADHTKWQEFTTRCWANGAASLECRLVIPGDNARPVLIQGVALKDHPDGFDSLLVNLRDQSQTRRLEHSIQIAEIDRLGNEDGQRAPRDQVEEAIAERLKLAVLAIENQAERRRLTQALEAQTADRQQREAKFVELEKRLEDSRVLLGQREREHGRGIAMLKSALAAAHAARITAGAGEEKQELETVKLRLQAATAEQARLQDLAAEYDADRKRIAVDHHAAVDTLEQSLARAGTEAAFGCERSSQALDELQSKLVQALAEQRRMAADSEEQKRERDLMRAEHHRALTDLKTGNGLALAELRSQLAQTSAEQGRQAARVDEHELAHDSLIAAHHRAIADMETGKRDALAQLRSQLSQAFADQRRLAERVEEHEQERDSALAEHHQAVADMETDKREALAELRSQLSQASADEELERERMRADHYRALADLETRKRDDEAAELRSQSSQTEAEQRRILAARAEEHERERDRMSAEHNLAIAGLQASKGEALTALRSQLSQAAAEHNRLTALLEEHDRERERMGAEYRRAVADLQVSKRETVAECERVLTDVQQALLVRDGSRLEIERRLIDGIDEGVRKKPDGDRLAGLQRGLTLAFSEMRAVLKDGGALNEPLETGHDELERPGIETIDKAAAEAAGSNRLLDVQDGLRQAVSETQTVGIDFDTLQDPFDDTDYAFVRDLLEGIRERPLPENLMDPTVGSAQAVSAVQTVTTGDQPAHEVFDAEDSTFVDSLMKRTPGPPRESAGQNEAEPLPELPKTQPAPPEDS